jgi:glycosyltransferase involved in cell wall biosynthesis
MKDATEIGVCSKHKATVLGPGTISGIDTEKFDRNKNMVNNVQLRRKAGIPDDSRIVGFVARVVPHKGIVTLLKAWRLLPSDIRSKAYLCLFGVYGHPKMKVLVKQAISEPDLHVKYMGFVDDMPAWYSAMTLLAQPSWHEGWGYNVLEAACNAVPAVGTRISATVDAIIDGQTGLLVPVKDEHAMAQALAKLLEDEGLRNKFGQAARERTIDNFKQEKIIPLLAQEYRRLLG